MNNHHQSIRIPKEMHDWVESFANKWHTSSAHVYRSAIREFIRKHTMNQTVPTQGQGSL